ncbi:endocuticle structural glycoprotein SgAbd-5 [Drosophila hydei]|uniref:Endocuticle structural glycoprotein SgAbd-5 n=1 Tax=Drosophila hydei TaxID=7224 RepID=A0A6J1LYB4_DROHY|nr:endocuticle structural glycoprotein SgAbd-5 [Drosophila hydei]
MQGYTLFFVVVCLVGSGVLALPRPDENAEVLRLESENNGIDKYSFNYETSNGIVRSEEGVLKPITGESEGVITVTGSSSWTTPDGKKYELSFTADETGYHPIVKLVS